MAETLGSLIDKICIAELKIYHMQEQIDRPDAPAEHKALCSDRLQILLRQRDDLTAELEMTAAAWSRGEWLPKVYRQFKMYNDPRFRVPQRAQ
jgi:hypothetical protein